MDELEIIFFAANCNLVNRSMIFSFFSKIPRGFWKISFCMIFYTGMLTKNHSGSLLTFFSIENLSLNCVCKVLLLLFTLIKRYVSQDIRTLLSFVYCWALNFWLVARQEACYTIEPKRWLVSTISWFLLFNWEYFLATYSSVIVTRLACKKLIGFDVLLNGIFTLCYTNLIYL